MKTITGVELGKKIKLEPVDEMEKVIVKDFAKDLIIGVIDHETKTVIYQNLSYIDHVHSATLRKIANKLNYKL